MHDATVLEDEVDDAYIHTYKLQTPTDRQTNRQTPIDRQTQTDRQTDT